VFACVFACVFVCLLVCVFVCLCLQRTDAHHQYPGRPYYVNTTTNETSWTPPARASVCVCVVVCLRVCVCLSVRLSASVRLAVCACARLHWACICLVPPQRHCLSRLRRRRPTRRATRRRRHPVAQQGKSRSDPFIPA
jgi:hypothetical protein